MQNLTKSDMPISNGKNHMKSLAALWPMQVDSVVPPPLILDISQCHVSHHITPSAGSAKRPQTEQECRTISLQFKEHLKQILPPKKPETGMVEEGGGCSNKIYVVAKVVEQSY